MASVLFLRGVNVGGHKAFRPAVLAREMAVLDVVNVGAAGTFVVRKKVAATALRAEVSRRIPFETELMICADRDVLDLVRDEPFPRTPAGPDIRRFVTVMAKRPRPIPGLPIRKPAGADWQVQVVSVSGVFALSLWRRLGRPLLYPNEVVEKVFGVPATTRSWDTLLKIHAVLED